MLRDPRQAKDLMQCDVPFATVSFLADSYSLLGLVGKMRLFVRENQHELRVVCRQVACLRHFIEVRLVALLSVLTNSGGREVAIPRAEARYQMSQACLPRAEAQTFVMLDGAGHTLSMMSQDMMLARFMKLVVSRACVRPWAVVVLDQLSSRCEVTALCLAGNYAAWGARL